MLARYIENVQCIYCTKLLSPFRPRTTGDCEGNGDSDSDDEGDDDGDSDDEGDGDDTK